MDEAVRGTGITIEILGDALAEIDETFALSLSPISGTPFGGTIPDMTITIVNGPSFQNIPTKGPDTLVGTSGNDSVNLLAGKDQL